MFSGNLRYKLRPAWARYGATVGCVFVAWFGREALTPIIGTTGLAFIPFFPVVAIATWYGGFGAGLLGIALSAATANWAFIPPVHAWSVIDAQDYKLVFFVLSSGFTVGAIQEMHRTEIALRESEERYRSLVSILADVPWGAHPDGVLFQPSPGFRRFTGLTEENKNGGGGWIGALHPDDRARIDELWRHACETHCAFEAHGRIWHGPSQSYHHCVGRAIPLSNPDGSVGEWIGALTDIHEQKTAEDALRLSEQRFHMMADSAPVMIWLAGTDKLCTWFNRQWLEFTGRTQEQECGNGWTHSVHQEDFDECLNIYVKSFEARCSFTMEYRSCRHDGEWRWVLNHGVPLYEGEEFVGYIGSCIDVTDRRRDEETLREALRAKDRFLARVSHELRTPLTPVTMMAGILQRNDTLPQSVKAALDVITQNVKFEAKLVDDLLDLSRANTGKFHIELNECDVHQIVENALRVCFGESEDKQLSLVTKLNAKQRKFPADAARIQQVFCNLIENAIKFTLPGGSITVSSRDNNGELCVDVSDTGRGIEPGMLERIFEPFAERDGAIGVRQSQSGLGLGLSIAHHIVSAHGGKILATSEGINRGATFTVSLPRSAKHHHSTTL